MRKRSHLLIGVGRKVLLHGAAGHHKEVDGDARGHAPLVDAAGEEARRLAQKGRVHVLCTRGAIVPVGDGTARVATLFRRRVQLDNILGISDDPVCGLKGCGDVVVDDGRKVKEVRACVAPRHVEEHGQVGDEHNIVVALDEKVVGLE